MRRVGFCLAINSKMTILANTHYPTEKEPPPRTHVVPTPPRPNNKRLPPRYHKDDVDKRIAAQLAGIKYVD